MDLFVIGRHQHEQENQAPSRHSPLCCAKYCVKYVRGHGAALGSSELPFWGLKITLNIHCGPGFSLSQVLGLHWDVGICSLPSDPRY